jgi:hypothetical protein
VAPYKVINLKPFKKLCRQDMANILGISPGAITSYVERGAPKNDDGTYDLALFVNHIITKRKRGSEPGENGDLDREIKEETLRRKKHENDILEGNVVPKEKLDQTLGARALSLSSYLHRALQENAQNIAMRPVEEIRPILDDVVRGTLDNYRGIKKGE